MRLKSPLDILAKYEVSNLLPEFLQKTKLVVVFSGFPINVLPPREEGEFETRGTEGTSDRSVPRPAILKGSSNPSTHNFRTHSATNLLFIFFFFVYTNFEFSDVRN